MSDQQAAQLQRSHDGNNVFHTGTALDFDYTMVSKMHGAQLGTQTKVGYLTNPSMYALGANPPELATPVLAASIKAFSGIPLFVEESTQFYNGRSENTDYIDGLWANNDQFETRHGGGCAVSFLEGHAEVFVAPHGGAVDTEEAGGTWSPGTFTRSRARGWIRMEPASLDWRRRPYGWINAPRQVAIP